MTTTPTAALIIRDLDRRAQQRHLDTLGDLDDTHSAAVRAALSAVPSRSKIDLRLLLDSVRREVAARVEAEAARQPDLAGVLRYRLSLMASGDLTKLRDDLRARVDAGDGDQPFEVGSAGASIMSRIDSINSRLLTRSNDVEPDDETGGAEPDEIDDAKPRRRVPRIRSKRVIGESSAPAGAPDRDALPRTRQTRSPGRPAALLSGRAFGSNTDDRPRGCPVGVDYEAWRNPARPPWLLTDGDEVEREAASA